MITNKGEAIISKYLIGQTTSYASFIAVGCGATPAIPGSTFTGGEITAFQAKKTLDFETLRVPVVSRGYVTEIVDDVPIKYLVITGQLPAEGRHGITEVGLYPAASNPVATGNDSRTVLSFSSNEQWSTIVDSVNTIVEESTIAAASDIISQSTTIFASTFDTVMANQLRQQNKEIPRNGVSSLLVPGTLTTFSSNVPVDDSSNDYLILSNPNIDLSSSSPADKLKIAFSVLSKDPTTTVSGTAKIVIEFGSAPGIADGGYARATFTKTLDTDNRYYVSEIDIKDISTSVGFSWSNVAYVKIFVNAGSANYLVALDGLRVDNINSESPVYGLVGYTVVKNSLTTAGGTTKAVPVVKEKDKTNLVEFRFRVSVV